MSKGEEILAPEKRVLVINDEEISLSKLTIGQVLELGKVAASAATQLADAIPPETLQRMQSNETTPAEDVTALLAALDESHLVQLLSVLTGKSAAWCKDNVDVGTALDILIEQNELQPLGELWGKVMRLREALTRS